MTNFDYAAPTSLKEATELLARYSGHARLLAGGTDLLVQLRERLRHANLVIDVKKIPELMELNYTPDQGLRLGASVPCYRVYDNPEVVAAYPALADAARIVGGWQIQSRASVGGNLCNSSPAADTIPPLIALDGRCQIVGQDGRRELRVENFCTGPGKNVLQREEILTTLVLPPAMRLSGSAYERFIPRNEMDIAVVGVAAWILLDDSGEAIEEARVALAAVAPRPLLATEANEWLSGQPCNEATYARAGELARRAAAPISDMRGTAEYRNHLVGVLVKRTLEKAVSRASENR